MLLFRPRSCFYVRKSAIIVFVLLCSYLTYIFGLKYIMQIIMPEENTSIATQYLESIQHIDEFQDSISQLLSEQLNPIVARKIIEILATKLRNQSDDKHEPSMEYEKLRKRVRQNTHEAWNYFTSEINKIKKKVSVDNPDIIDKISNVTNLIAEHKYSLISDMDQMRLKDGYEQWRHDEAKSLSDLVQRRLHYLQNPSDCKNARKLVCTLNTGGCGFGCKLHHTIYCLILAYSTERTLILISEGRIYNNVSWEDIFQPLSETCMINDPVKPKMKWPGPNDAQVLSYEIGKEMIIWPPFLPHSIPADLAPRLIRLYSDPAAWWVGQFHKYLVRPKNATQAMLETRMKELSFEKPIVGVHIRRTDKLIKEASFHSIEEYMTYAEDYFLQLEGMGTNIKRRVFIATDAAGVIDEVRQKYPLYEIIADPDVAKLAAVSTRYTGSSLNGIISDMLMLSLCDYVVCTFSSNICRTAYEIMHTMHLDASDRVKSIDDIYFYKKPGHNVEVFLEHNPQSNGELYMKPGDQIYITSNIRNGYSKGKNTRTNQTGIFPSFKVNEQVEIVELPTYTNVT